MEYDRYEFYDRYVALCAEKNLKPQTPEMLRITGVTPASISGWKQGSMPKADTLFRIADYFNVTIDYLLGRSEVKNPLKSQKEQILLDAFRSADDEGQMNIIYVCMDEKRKAEAKGKDTASA